MMDKLNDRQAVVAPRKFEMAGVRYVFTGMGFLGFCTIYALRVNINVAIIAMVNGTAIYDANRSRSDECPAPAGPNTTAAEQTADGEFLWSPKMQGLVLGAFYYGYCVSQIPGGRLAEIFSAKWVFGIGTVTTALLNLLTPIAAQTHVILLIVIRIVEGLAQGVTMPAMHAMLARWLPEGEKGLLSTFVYSGINIGTVVAMPLAGLLCRSTLFGGWPSAFYVFGIFGCLWFVLWIQLVSDSPRSHRFITKKEVRYITSDQEIERYKTLPPIPWLKVFTSAPFWALMITQFGNDWCFYTFNTDLPTFAATVLHFDLEKNGFLSSFPYLLQFLVGISVGYVTDTLIRRGKVKKSCVRKFCNTFSSVTASLCLVGVCLSGCNAVLTMTFITASMAIGGFCFCGYMLSHLDLSPEYAGTLMGITNTFSNLTGFIVPAIVGSLTDEYQTLQQWRIVFYITIGVLLSSGILFLIFSTTDKQDWVDSSAKYAPLESDSDASLTYGSVNDSPNEVRKPPRQTYGR